MFINKEGYSLGCEKCRCHEETDGNNIEIKVPVTDLETGRKGMAFIDCELIGKKHELTLTRIEGPDGFEMQLSDEARMRLNRLLEILAKDRLCGNDRICPEQIVQFVRSHNQA